MLDTRCLRREGMYLFVSLPDLQRREAAPDWMPPQPLAVVEGLDEGEDLSAGSGPVGPAAGADLRFQQREEALGGGIVVALAGSGKT